MTGLFPLITIFSMSVTVTMLDILFNMTNSLNNVCFAFGSIVCVGCKAILSGNCKTVQSIKCRIVYIPMVVLVQLSGVLYGGVFIYTAIFYAVLFWSNINLLGVLITTKIRKLIMQGNEVAAYAATGALGLFTLIKGLSHIIRRGDRTKKNKS